MRRQRGHIGDRIREGSQAGGVFDGKRTGQLFTEIYAGPNNILDRWVMDAPESSRAIRTIRQLPAEQFERAGVGGAFG